MRKIYLNCGIIIFVGLVFLEIFARTILGLGTPPLIIEHPTIEYMFKPNQDVNRFGNRFAINQYGMRSNAIAAEKPEDEFRVMLFGDSVLNGGAQTDQKDLATTIIAQRLEIPDRKTLVGNVSAGSWGPGNWLAYANEYGFFDADCIVLVISSHDISDNPSFKALNPQTHPRRNPRSALLEGVFRYLPRYLPALTKVTGATQESDRFESASEDAVALGSRDLRKFLAFAKTASRYVLVVQHWERAEVLNGSPKEGIRLIRSICADLAIPVVSLQEDLSASHKAGNTPWRDNIHLNVVGQQILAEAVLRQLQAEF